MSEPRLTRVLCSLITTLLLGARLIAADTVVPGPDVTTRVIVRASASGSSVQVGALLPGQAAQLIGSVPNWHEVQLANGVQGFVSKRWTRVVSSGGPPPPPPPPTASFTIDVLDVGTGLSVLVRGQDFNLLYDGGSNDDLARGPSNRVLAYLKTIDSGMTTLNHVFLSHPHRDHVELLPDVINTYTVNDVWDSGAVNNICGYRAFLAAISNKPGIRYHNALQDGGTMPVHFPAAPLGCYGDPAPDTTVTLTLAGRITNTPMALGQQATMTILHADGGTHSTFNENTIVVRLDLGNTRVLLMGDAQAGNRALPTVPPTSTFIEGVLLDCCASELAANVMIVGHHGSETSSRRAFMTAVGASIFVVSSGPTKYATVVLPDDVIISELQGLGQVFRTDQNDAACATNPAKVGPTSDGKAGGCNAVRITIPASGHPSVSSFPDH